ncbi:cyclin-T-like isoform X2 [Culicoides brevitarsis]|uniref:cyclin-T-like isoform X2 n=1 Tax=Culicoides brevitarsis TaxID=469753 RepID=UPI00307C1306
MSQLCINTAIVYMHRYYAFHSLTNFHRNSIAAAALFLAAKVEEQPRKLEHVIRVTHLCLNQEPPDPTKEPYQELAQDLVFNENVLLQTLGFDVAIDHPHTHVVKTCGLVKASKELAQTSYFMASNSLHLTTMCLQYRPTVVACFCIHLACKWSRWEIPQSTEGKHWFQYVDKTVTLDLLKQLTDEFLHIFDKCPTRLKRLKTLNNSTQQAAEEQRKAKEEEQAAAGSSASSSNQRHHGHSSSSKIPPLDHQKSSSSRMSGSSSSSSQMQQQRAKMDRPSSGTSHSSSYPSSSDKNMMAGQHMRPPSGQSSSSSSSSSSSRDPHFNKGRPHSMGGSSSQQQQQQQQQQSSGMKDRHSTGNGQQPPPPHMKHDKMMKIHPASIGVNSSQMDPTTMRKQQQQQQPPYPGQNPHKMPPGYNQQQPSMQKHKSMPPSMKQNHAKHHQQQPSSQASSQNPHSMPQMPLASQSFKLLDESVISDTTLKSSPTHMSQPNKPSSIFSPDWKDSGSSMPPSLTQNLSNPQQQRTSNAPNRNNNNSQPLYKTSSMDKKQQQSQPPPLIGIGMSSSGTEMDFIKQEKLSNEPPQQLLAPGPKEMKDLKSVKRPPSSLEEDRDFKMRRLEARMEGSDPMPDLQAAIKQEDHKASLENKWPQQPPYGMPPQKQQRPPEDMMRQITGEQIKRESDKWSKSRGVARDMYGQVMQTQQPPPPMNYNDTQSMMFQQNLNMPGHPGMQQQPMMMPPMNNEPKPKPLSSVNGIETNPDLIRSLLKESFSAPSTILPISDTPGPLLSDNVDSNLAGIDSLGMTTPAAADNIDSSHHRKSEKKKKKEKHKHKEKSKDKDKDREERKKHKKDKDRHRDKSREREHHSASLQQQNLLQQQQNMHQQDTSSMKITIPKTKISLSASGDLSDVNNIAATAPSSGGLKIKIPKDRIKASGGAPPATLPNDQASGIKIKISRNQIEGYNSNNK